MIKPIQIHEYKTNFSSPSSTDSSVSDSDVKNKLVSQRAYFLLPPLDSNDESVFNVNKSTGAVKENHVSVRFIGSWKIKNVIRQVQNCIVYIVTIAPKKVIRDLFFPTGFPDSVRPGYLEYQFYDSIQGLSSYLRGVISTSAVLTAAGVGDAEATAISTTVNWALRDGLGMAGGLIFSYIASNNFDSHVKEFRLFADVINDIGLTLDMLAPCFVQGRNTILYVSSLATLCRVMCGISAGATKSSITQHFAVRGNIADLNAKEGTQETLVSLLGMLMGIALAQYLHFLDDKKRSNDSNTNASGYFSWIMFSVLTLIHVWANYCGVKMLRLRTLNRERAEMAFDKLTGICAQYVENNYMSYNGDSMRQELGSTLSACKISNPDEVNESMYKSMMKLIFPGSIVLGARLDQALQSLPIRDCHQLINNEFKDEKYMISVQQGGILRKTFLSKKTIFVTVRLLASEIHELKAFLHACILKKILLRSSDNLADDVLYSLISTTHDIIEHIFTNGIVSSELLEQRGWSQERLHLGYSPWRAQWEPIKKKHV